MSPSHRFMAHNPEIRCFTWLTLLFYSDIKRLVSGIVIDSRETSRTIYLRCIFTKITYLPYLINYKLYFLFNWIDILISLFSLPILLSIWYIRLFSFLPTLGIFLSTNAPSFSVHVTYLFQYQFRTGNLICLTIFFFFVLKWICNKKTSNSWPVLGILF